MVAEFGPAPALSTFKGENWKPTAAVTAARWQVHAGRGVHEAVGGAQRVTPTTPGM